MFWAVLWVCHLICGAPAANGFPNEPEGFQSVKWGTPVEAVRGLVFLRHSVEREGFEVYTGPLDGLKVENLAPNGVEYEFWRGRLVRAAVTIAPLAAFVQLRDALFRRYGRGYAPSERAERYYWTGEKTDIALVSRFDIS